MIRYIIDLDGTLAYHESWQGKFHIGDPIPGAVDFVKKLRSNGDAHITIFTRRMSDEYFRDDEVYQAIKNWLNRHGFPWDVIHTDGGKPDGTAFIDDRGVACRPQDNPNAYDEAIQYINSHILSKKRKVEDNNEKE